MNNKKKELIRSVKFLLFSISAGIIELVLSELLNAVTPLPEWASYLIALVVSVIYNFTINRKVTFHSAANVPIAMLKVAGYYCVFTPLSTLLEDYLTATLGWYSIFATILNMVINFVTEFLFTRFVVYGKQVDNDAKYVEKEAKKSKKALEQATKDINKE